MILMLLLINHMVHAAESSPKEIVQEIFSRASQEKVAHSQEDQAAINAMVDFDALAASALGKEKKNVSAKEFLWFRETLREIITLTVYPKAPDFLKGVTITYDSMDQKGTKTFVNSSVQNKSDLTEVNYEMKKTKEGFWRVVDVSIAGLSWAESINEQVRDVVRKKKWKGLKEAMNKKLKELKSGTAKG